MGITDARRYALIAILVAVPFVVYSNSYHHAFQLDDAYTVVTNPSVRSLQTIPRYFVDAGTYTSIREQAEYRPLLQLTYALNYRLGGYEMPWWHFTQILLHVVVTLGIFAFCRRLLQMLGDPRPDAIAFAAAIIFAIHPGASGVVNYVNARSSLLVAAFLLPALLEYMTPVESADYTRPQWRTAAWYLLALFTKVEALGVVGALWAYDLWQRGRETPDASFFSSVRASFDRRTLKRLAPVLVVSAVYLVIRWRVMAPFPLSESRHAPDVGPYEYFLTQLTVWWYYVARWLAPVRLVADYLAYPVYRSWADPDVLLALAGWIAVATLIVLAWRRAAYVGFLAIACLALLSPTSTIAPLAEMANEHRPYLPLGLLSLALIVPVGQWLRGTQRQTRVSLATAGVLLTVSLSAMTYQRNSVFATARQYWADVLGKAPSARAHLNYGVALMATNEMPAAMRQFQQSLELAPFWFITHINLGIAYQHVGQTDSARAHFDQGVQYDRFNGLGLTHRGEFHLELHEYTNARDDFLQSMAISLDRYRNGKGLATAYAGAGDVERSLDQVWRLIALDSASAFRDIPAISNPYFEATGDRAAGIAFYERLSQRFPSARWMSENIERLKGLAAASNAR